MAPAPGSDASSTASTVCATSRPSRGAERGSPSTSWSRLTAQALAWGDATDDEVGPGAYAPQVRWYPRDLAQGSPWLADRLREALTATTPDAAALDVHAEAVILQDQYAPAGSSTPAAGVGRARPTPRTSTSGAPVRNAQSSCWPSAGSMRRWCWRRPMTATAAGSSSR